MATQTMRDLKGSLGSLGFALMFQTYLWHVKQHLQAVKTGTLGACFGLGWSSGLLVVLTSNSTKTLLQHKSLHSEPTHMSSTSSLGAGI